MINVPDTSYFMLISWFIVFLVQDSVQYELALYDKQSFC